MINPIVKSIEAIAGRNRGRYQLNGVGILVFHVIPILINPVDILTARVVAKGGIHNTLGITVLMKGHNRLQSFVVHRLFGPRGTGYRFVE